MKNVEVFDFESMGFFSEVTEEKMLDVIGGACGGGGGWGGIPTDWKPSLPKEAGGFGTSPSL